MKVKKILGVILTLAVILTVGTVTAFAADGEIAADDFGTMGLTKTLNVADGITTNPKAFTFSFTAQASDTVAVTDVPSVADVTVNVGDQTNGVATGSKTFSEIFTGITFPHAGEYIYEVKETTAAFETTENGITKKLTVDASTYTVHVYVVNGANGPEASKIVVKKADGNKADLAFENTYTEVIANPLVIVKSITGDYADKTKEFPVKVTLTIPATATAADVEVKAPWTVTGTAPTLVVEANLADGGRIEFTKLPAGTTFVVEETQDSAYTSKTTGFVAAEDSDYVTGDVNKTGKGPVVVAGNEVDIENHRENLVPTGVVIENLPYVLLFVIAVAGVVYLHLKKKARA